MRVDDSVVATTRGVSRVDRDWREWRRCFDLEIQDAMRLLCEAQVNAAPGCPTTPDDVVGRVARYNDA